MAAPITITQIRDLGRALLDWYDRMHRTLPWRVSPAEARAGGRPDPYRIWLSEVMLQQTTVAAVEGYFRAFTTRWPTVGALAASPLEDVLAAWAGLGYYARARNLHACAQVVARDLGGRFPDTEDALLRLPGIGPYTAAAIAAIAFDRPAVVMDGNIERVMARLFAETDPLPRIKPRLRAHAARLTPDARPGDHAQALMDLGATICTPRRPACAICPLRPGCAGQAAGIAETLPTKAPKRPKPVREGIAWAAFDGDRIMVVRRPAKGLLGGMLALPSSGWEGQARPAPVAAEWHPVGEVRHTFTHFHLRLEIERAAYRGALPEGAAWLPRAEAEAGMPTLFRKAVRLLGSA
ncbi:MAG: A/G-specific adenine glycosylase [Paracoccaceae bacterium]